ncbi:NAC domain-containing protein [Drosera capensis]
MGSDGSSSTTSLAPGFRFHPTDEELVSYYLRRKLSGKPFRFDAIGDIDIYKTEPWLLPGLSKLKTRDLEWYFFSSLDKKYGNGSRTNRATEEGYWKTTGKDRAVYHKSRMVGMKKTLVYHQGRAPRGARTNWVMHEYRSIDQQLENAGIHQEPFVLCRIFQKSGSGPKNGEKYGAPLLDEEWEDENIVAIMPGSFGSNGALVDEAYIEQDDFNQGLDAKSLTNANSPPDFTFYEDGGQNLFSDTGKQKPMFGTLENPLSLEFPDDQGFFDLPLEGDMVSVKNDSLSEQDNIYYSAPAVATLDQQSQDPGSNAPFDDGLFLEGNLSTPVDPTLSDLDLLDQYLTYFDAEDDIEQYLSFDTSELLDAEFSLSDQAFSTEKHVAETAQAPAYYGQQILEAVDDASSSKQHIEKHNSISDLKHPLNKHLNRMLGNIPAPPAYASELPSKVVASQLNGDTPSPGPVHVTTGMVRLTGSSFGVNALQWSLDKLGNVNVVLSFELTESHGLASPSKMASAVSRGLFCFLFFSFLILAVSVKIGTCIYAK